MFGAQTKHPALSCPLFTPISMIEFCYIIKTDADIGSQKVPSSFSMY